MYVFISKSINISPIINLLLLRLQWITLEYIKVDYGIRFKMKTIPNLIFKNVQENNN